MPPKKSNKTIKKELSELSENFYPDSESDIENFNDYDYNDDDDDNNEDDDNNDEFSDFTDYNEYKAKGGKTEQNESIDDDDVEDDDNLDDNVEIDDEDGEITSDDESIDTDIDDEDCLYKYADEDGEDQDIDVIDKIVKKEDRITKPRMTKYERVRIIGDRTKQLSLGAKPLIKNAEHLPPKEIAELELKHDIIPLIIERPLPNNKKEKWYTSELQH